MNTLKSSNAYLSILMLGAALSLGACASGTAEPSTDATDTAAATNSNTPPSPSANPQLRGRYTNLGDDASLKEVTQRLEDAGLPTQDVENFAAQVRSLNQVAPAKALVSNWTPLSQAKSDDGTIATATQKQARLTDCRITTFTLAHSLITIGNPAGADTSLLFMDLEQIEVPPALFGENKTDFEALYGRIATTSDHAKEPRQSDIEKYFNDHQISFRQGPVSIISVYIHDTIDPQAYSFVGHTGVLVDNHKSLLFVEKLAFDAPYRAIEFASRAELQEYLDSLYDDGPNMEYGQPLFFENGAPLRLK